MVNDAPPPPNAAQVSTESDDSAGFWLRAGAYMIDGILVAIVSVILNLILPESISIVARILLSAGYFTVMPVQARGQTLGKMAAGIAIVRDDGTPLTYGRAFVRWLGYLLSGLTFCIGFACAAFTNRKRALHDYLADTRVIRVEALGSGRKYAVGFAGLLFPLLILLGIAAAISLPKFEAMKNQEDERVAKGNLGALRSALAAYASDAKGAYPADLNQLVPKYTAEIPSAALSNPPAAGVETYGPEVCSGSKEPGAELIGDKLRDTGKWGYVVAPKAPCDGKIFVDSKNTDSKGAAWTAY
ncbi:MAG: RDD family protein [Elusimicrobiota bacterium]